MFFSIGVEIQKSVKSLSHVTFTGSIPNNERLIFSHDCYAMEIYISMIKLDSGKATSIDEISTKICEACPHVLAQPLSVVINDSFPKAFSQIALKSLQ